MNLDERNSELNETLDDLYDSLNDVIELAEESLVAMKMTGGVLFVYDDSTRACIGIEKLNGKWRLCHGYQIETEVTGQIEIDWKPLRDSSIRERMESVLEVDYLREAVVKAKESLIPNIDSAIRQMTEMIGGWQQDRAEVAG